MVTASGRCSAERSCPSVFSGISPTGLRDFTEDFTHKVFFILGFFCFNCARRGSVIVSQRSLRPTPPRYKRRC